MGRPQVSVASFFLLLLLAIGVDFFVFNLVFLQVHGYDLTSLAALGRFRYAGAADEKVVRLFEAPRDFRANLARLCRGVHLVDQGLHHVSHYSPFPPPPPITGFYVVLPSFTGF